MAFRKRTGYDPRFPDARPWLYGIATNLIAQHRRQEARQFRLRQAAGPAPVAHDWAERSVVNVTAQSVRAPLAKALARLVQPDRDVLLLVAWEQLSYDEVARALDIPVGTVRSRLHRARTKIREALAETPAAATYEEILTNE
ncbi:MAG: RNA polymerase sigma factor [Jatrophihabitantaceae bacterium]